jgi:hypothetical protein
MIMGGYEKFQLGMGSLLPGADYVPKPVRERADLLPGTSPALSVRGVTVSE